MKHGKPPEIFLLMGQYVKSTFNVNLNKNLRDYILKHTNELWTIYDGFSVFAYAACTNLECLKTVYLSYQQALAQGYKLFHIAPYNLKASRGYTPLHSAIEFHSTLSASYLINDVHVDIDITDDQMNTPLHVACKTGNIHIMKNLVIVGARVNVLNASFQTPLYLCVLNDDIESCKFLLSKGAKTIFKTGRFLVNAPLDITKIGSDRMKTFFKTYNQQQTKKRQASEKAKKRRKTTKERSKQYEFLCSQLDDESNIELVKSLAQQLNLTTANKTKKDICNKILTKLGILSIRNS